MDEKALPAIAHADAKNVKPEADLNEFRQVSRLENPLLRCFNCAKLTELRQELKVGALL